MVKHLVFSETHEKYSIDDYINQGDNGPWYDVVPLHDFDLMTKEIEEVKVNAANYKLCFESQRAQDKGFYKRYTDLRTDLALAVSALEFYAEPDSWEKSEIDSLDVNDCNSDAISSNTPWGYPVNKGGKHAREALSKINQTEGNNDES